MLNIILKNKKVINKVNKYSNYQFLVVNKEDGSFIIYISAKNFNFKNFL